MINVIGTSNGLILFTNGDSAAVVDPSVNLVLETGHTAELTSSRSWTPSDEQFSSAVVDLANGALTTLDISIVAAAGRMYTIPKAVQVEAKRALDWRAEEDRGGTPVGLSTARRLAKGGQVSLATVRHIAKYFPRHEVDKKAEGYKPGEEGFPSNGRIAWALWGGDAGWRWSQAIVESENKKAVTAHGYVDSYNRVGGDYGVDTDAFKNAYDFDEDAVPEFLARVRLDGSGIDRLYKIDAYGQVFVWDGNCWEDLGHVNGDIYTYDSALDDRYDECEKSHVVIDPDSAIIISARLMQDPYKAVSIEDIDHDEAMLVATAMGEVDWDMVDRVSPMVAGGESVPATAGEESTDGKYTPEERSKNASSQVRDKGGKFAANGSRVVVGGDVQNGVGNITKVDGASGTVDVKLDSGKTVTVNGNLTEKAENYITSVAPETVDIAPIDTAGILGQPRTPIDRPNAKIPGTLPAMTSAELQTMLRDFPSFVSKDRAGYKSDTSKAAKPSATATPRGKNDPRTPLDRAADPKQLSPEDRALTKAMGRGITLDAYKHPLLSSWLTKKGSNGPNSMYYQPITADGTPAPEAEAVTKEKIDNASQVLATATETNPDNSDVQPLYIAIVSPDDPRAVLDLVSLVPASTAVNTPTAFKRIDGEWIKDDGILSDLQSSTPPPVVPLDSETLKVVIEQVDVATVAASGLISLDHVLTVLWGPNREDIAVQSDSYIEALVAAGGIGSKIVDKIQGRLGNAERLRVYWTTGKGGAKIRWNTGGDWKRCVRNLSKFLGPRAKGYCALRHHEMTGMWTGDKKHRAMYGRKNASMKNVLSLDEASLLTSSQIVEQTALSANARAARSRLEAAQLHTDIGYSLQDLLAEDIAVIAAAGSKPAAKKDQRRGSDRNKKGSAGTGASVTFSAQIEKSLANKVTKHNENAKEGRKANIRALKAVYRRGAGAFSSSHRPGQNRNSWAMARVNAYLHLLKSGTPKNSKYVQDNDILPASHPRSSKSSASVITSSGELGNSGSMFRIPLVIPEDHESGDGRTFAHDSIEMRDLPLPLLWQIRSADGHMGSVVVGRIDHMERTANGIGNAYGVFDTGEYGAEAERLVRSGFLRGVSADMDKFEAEEAKTEAGNKTDDEKIGSSKLNITKARVMAVTIVPKPAFQECKIYLVDPNQNQEENMIPNGVYVENMDPVEAETLVACGFVAGAIPANPPSNWFENPKLSKATPLTVTDDGRVFGHIAAWHVDHIGMSFGTKPPRSKSSYSYFHTGVVRTDDGSDAPVGQLTLAGGHASLEASAAQAAKHYDDTASAVADVHAGEDAHGIWVSGSLRPGTTPEQIRALRASAPSGDWRPIKGQLELVAVCQVNVPGFPIARARVASGQVMALVAAGASVLAHMKNDPIAELTARIAKLEQLDTVDLSAQADAARRRFAELSAMTSSESNLNYSEKKRDELAKKGYALPNGSYPIVTVSDLKRAIKGYGRSNPSDRAKVRRHIAKRARQLKQGDLIPENWKALSTEEVSATVDDLRARLAVIASGHMGKAPAAEPVTPGAYTPVTQPRDSKGKFREVLARLKYDLGKSGLQSVVDEVNSVEQLNEAGNYTAASVAAGKLLGIVDRIDIGALDPKALSNVKASAKQLGTVLANLPLAFGQDTETMRFSDLPPALQDLVDDMMSRVEKKIGDKDAGPANKVLKEYKAGGRQMNQRSVSSQLSKLLRILT